MLGRKLIFIRKCKSIVAMDFECYFFNQLLHYNVCRYGVHYLEMMMSVFKGLAKNYT